MAEKNSKEKALGRRLRLWPFAAWKKGDAESKAPVTDSSQNINITIEMDSHSRKRKRDKLTSKWLAYTYSLIAICAAIVAVCLIGVSTLSALTATQLDPLDRSRRLVALIVLAVTGATAIAVVVYAQVAVCSRKNRPIFVATIVLSILALIQAIIAGASTRVTNQDRGLIIQGLEESFNFAKQQHNPRHNKMWTAMQYTLNCCGLNSPFDYRNPNTPIYMPPDVPISCCHSYDPHRSDLVQEKEREICKARNQYYGVGCSGPVLTMMTDTSHWVFVVAIVLIIFELLSAIIGAFVVKTRKAHTECKHENLGLGQSNDQEANEKQPT